MVNFCRSSTFDVFQAIVVLVVSALIIAGLLYAYKSYVLSSVQNELDTFRTELNQCKEDIVVNRTNIIRLMGATNE